MFWLSIFLFLLGTVWGSFLNVVIYRSSRGLSFVLGRSKCPKCKKKLRWFHNIPLLSYLFLKGKCAYCHKRISLMYPVVEFMTGLFFIWWFWVGFGFFKLIGSPFGLVQPIFWLIVGLVLLAIFVSDLLYMIIPFYLNMFLFSLVFVYRLFLLNFGYLRPFDFLMALLVGLVLAGFFLAMNWLTQKLRRMDGFGMGDVWLSPTLGLLLGWPKILPAFMISFVSGSIVAIVLVFLGKKKWGQYLPFGPFLILGTVLALLYGSQIWGWYTGLLV